MASILGIDSQNVDWEEAFANFKKKLIELESFEKAPIEILRSQIKLCRIGLSEVKDFVNNAGFADEEFEIRFFKYIKPRFFSLLIYYSKIFEIEIRKPLGNKIGLREYLVRELKIIKEYFARNEVMYLYYRSGDKYLDKKLFMRNREEFDGLIYLFYFNNDGNLSTPTDYLFAKMMAYEMLSYFLSGQLESLESDGIPVKTSKKNVLPWAASTVALGELIYALHATSVFEGKKDVRSIALFFSEMFNVKISNIYKIFEEIRLRKKNRTSFIDSLRTQLIRKMDEDDERG